MTKTSSIEMKINNEILEGIRERRSVINHIESRKIKLSGHAIKGIITL